MKIVIDIPSWSGDESVDNLVLRRRLLKEPGNHDIDGLKCTVVGEVQSQYEGLLPYVCGTVTP